MKFRRACIVACEPHDNYKLWIRFDDGISGEVDLSKFVGKGVFKAWNSIDSFKKVYIEKTTDTVAWGKDIDLDPYVLRELIISNSKK